MLWWRRKPKPKNIDTLSVLSFLARQIEEIAERQAKIMGDTSQLTAAVAANTQAVADIQALVGSLQGGAVNDQAQIDAATSQIAANNAALEALKTPAPVTPPSS